MKNNPEKKGADKMEYELVMGLEVHVELSTETKLFCACSTAFGAEPNENVCPACCGMPGMPPVLNKRAVELGVTAALLTGCEISRTLTFDKKNYFYPDLPTGYQNTQFFNPVGRGGSLEVETASGKKTIRIKQIHIEEDAGKLVHERGKTLVDCNRAGVPLIEIVSEADFSSAEEVTAYLERLRALLSFANVSDCRMQEGSMRCDVNLSVRPYGETVLGTRTEIKNMNSLKAIARAIEYEYGRHTDALADKTEVLVQETRRWDDARGVTYAMREKEDATDYRYFSNPEVLPVALDDAWFEQIRASVPETSEQKKIRFLAIGLPEYDAAILARTKSLADIFDAAHAHISEPKEISNRIIMDLIGMSKEAAVALDEIKIDGKKMARLIGLTASGKINRAAEKLALYAAMTEDADPDEFIAARGLAMVGGGEQLERLADEVLAENEKSVSEIIGGNQKAMGFLIGKLMKKTEGKADPKAAAKIIEEKISRIKARQ